VSSVPYDTGLIAWLRGLADRRPTSQIDIRDPVDQRFSATAVTERLVRLHELQHFSEDEAAPYRLLVELTPLGAQMLAENP
jgi:hypothetical protein